MQIPKKCGTGRRRGPLSQNIHRRLRIYISFPKPEWGQVRGFLPVWKNGDRRRSPVLFYLWCGKRRTRMGNDGKKIFFQTDQNRGGFCG